MARSLCCPQGLPVEGSHRPKKILLDIRRCGVVMMRPYQLVFGPNTRKGPRNAAPSMGAAAFHVGVHSCHAGLVGTKKTPHEAEGIEGYLLWCHDFSLTGKAQHPRLQGGTTQPSPPPATQQWGGIISSIQCSERQWGLLWPAGGGRQRPGQGDQGHRSAPRCC